MGESALGFAHRWTRRPRYAPSLRGGGWGQNCYHGCRDLNYTRTGPIIIRAFEKRAPGLQGTKGRETLETRLYAIPYSVLGVMYKFYT